MSVRILLVDDHKIMREGLRNLIEQQSGMGVVAEAENGRTALRLNSELEPDVILMDINMPDLNGIDATRQIISDFPKVKIIAFSMHSDRQFVIGMLKAGVSGYLPKDCAFEELAGAIRSVIGGQTYLSPKIMGIVVKDYLKQGPTEGLPATENLTTREREVLQLIAEGRATRQIADRLHLSIKTVETHRRNIMEKLNIHNVAELTKYAIREGLTSINT